MAIKAHTAGSLSFTEIASEWGGSQPHSLDEYHSGESLVYSGATGAPGGSTTTIPSSGTISFSNFYASEAFSTTSAVSTTGTVPVPSGANAIYIVSAFGAGGGGYRGADYDKAGGESAGPGGGGGSAQIPTIGNTAGGAGGAGSISYQFVRIV